MRLVLAACLLVVAGTASPADDKKPKKPDRPKLDAKEWKKLDSGLEVWDVKEGKGDAAKAGEMVTVHYTGWLTDDKATEFDSSLTDGKPATFTLKRGKGGVIGGWVEGIPGMKPGGVRRLKVPAALAYGDAGHPAGIPPKAVLVFEVEFIK
jgi:FKBP-type peptidyl-prolyl cis-trans isomerase